MRVWLSVYFTFISILYSYAQDDRAVRSLKAEADKYYEDEQYTLAIEDYRELADQNIKDAGVGFKLAECYRKTFNYAEAETYYLKVHFLSPKEYPLSLYYFALMLKFNGNFDEAIQYFNEFINLHQPKGDVKDFVEQAIIDRSGCEAAKEDIKSDKGIYPRFYPKLNTTFNDFAPAVRDSTNLVISSGRVLSNRQSIDERFGEAFTDNFYFEKQGNNWVDKTKQLFNITNTQYNDGSGCFNKKGDKYYYTVCGEDGPQCRIFVTEFKNKKWTTPVALNTNINFKGFEARQPAISHGGDSLVFASNRTGGSGGFDLWMSINAGGENWGPPMNMGNSINTKLNELAPAFTSFPNILFFASDGHEGFGGLDLYMSKRMSTGEINLYNLGSPFNSNRDDCFLSFSERELYWSSNRNEGMGGFDILAVKIPSVPVFISRMSLKKGNARRDIRLQQKTEDNQNTDIQASRLEERIDYDRLTYEKQKIVDKIIEDRASNKVLTAAQYNVSPAEFETLKRIAEQKSQLEKRRRGYLSKINSPATGKEEILVTGVLRDSVSGKALTARKVFLTDKNGEVIKITSTNDEGKFRFTAIGQGEFLIRVETSASLNGVVPTLRNLSITKVKEQAIVQVENIYFDFDHYRLRPEAQRVLDELAIYLKVNTNAQLEIFAFADDRGTNDYNLKLTQKRGQSVVDYLIRKGVDQTGLAIIAKGRQAQREIDVDLQRQYNRRIEFYLNDASGSYKESAKTYILKKQVDWATLSKVTGVPINELKDLNGISEDKLKAFQPVRLPIASKAAPPDIFFGAF